MMKGSRVKAGLYTKLKRGFIQHQCDWSKKAYGSYIEVSALSEEAPFVRSGVPVCRLASQVLFAGLLQRRAVLSDLAVASRSSVAEDPARVAVSSHPHFPEEDAERSSWAHGTLCFPSDRVSTHHNLYVDRHHFQVRVERDLHHHQVDQDVLEILQAIVDYLGGLVVVSSPRFPFLTSAYRTCIVLDVCHGHLFLISISICVTISNIRLLVRHSVDHQRHMGCRW